MIRLVDIAKALEVSIGTVDRALHDRPGVNAVTKRRVQQMARSMGYRPNLAASVLSSKRRLRISVNLPEEIASFFNHVRAGIESEHMVLSKGSIDLEFRSFPRLGVGEVEAFDDALEASVNGIITAVGHPGQFLSRIRKALRRNIPVVCVVADATGSDRIAAVTIDTRASGGLVCDLMGRFLRERGEVAVFTGELTTADHVEKVESFSQGISRHYTHLKVLPPIETHDRATEAFDKALRILRDHPSLVGCYITTANSLPVLRALKRQGKKGKITVITTDLFSALVPYLRSGAVAASIHQRPRAQGQLALRILQGFLRDGTCPTDRVTLAPHVVTRSNLDYFLTQYSLVERSI
jgi:LacI family transcriptional regulator, galactose operon repressor